MTTKEIILSDRPTVSEIRPIKEAAKLAIKEMNGFPKSVTHVALVAVMDTEKRDFLVRGLSAIGVSALVLTADAIPEVPFAVPVATVNPNDLFAFDFFIFDGEHDGLDVVKSMKAGVVPVMLEKNVFAGILKAFNPMRFEGNGFFFKNDDPFSMFASCISYLENSKFPEDRRILIKHVLETF